MSQSFPPPVVLLVFLRNLRRTIQATEEVILVLRGSLLLQHWFGDSARPPGDIDLECFARNRPVVGLGQSNPVRQRFTSLVDHARQLCFFATYESHPGNPVSIDFDGESLWEYGSPGERFYLGWRWHAQGDLGGHLQLDIAQSGSYDLTDLYIADEEFAYEPLGGFSFLAYRPETMLAAKLSSLMRSWTRRLGDDGVGEVFWKGEPKDLFDIHLLLTKSSYLMPELFQKALLAIGASDQLEWNHLQAIFDVRRGRMKNVDFSNWTSFQKQHPTLAISSPVEMLQTIADRLEPLLGDFYRREEMPFLLAINNDPADEGALLVYADWLEERGNARANVLRLFAKFFYWQDHPGSLWQRTTNFVSRLYKLPPKELVQALIGLRTAFRVTAVPWMLQLFGTTARYRAIRQRIEDDGP